MTREIRKRTEVQRQDVLYEVLVDDRLVWSRRVPIGRGEHHGPGGTMMQMASREQDKIAAGLRCSPDGR